MNGNSRGQTPANGGLNPWTMTIVGLIVVVGLFFACRALRERIGEANEAETEATPKAEAVAEGKKARPQPRAAARRAAEDEDVDRDDDDSSSDSADEKPEPLTPEERAEEEEEKAVETFDNLTDKWQEPAKDVTMDDIDRFLQTFRKIPEKRREECLQRALNLVPDENVMLLAGVLMDKSLGKEMVELVFNDILNRDEDVKRPILQQVFKDKTHPCWADTAWILDVTGDKKRSDTH